MSLFTSVPISTHIHMHRDMFKDIDMDTDVDTNTGTGNRTRIKNRDRAVQNCFQMPDLWFAVSSVYRMRKTKDAGTSPVPYWNTAMQSGIFWFGTRLLMPECRCPR
jgi:hypothetical protein